MYEICLIWARVCRCTYVDTMIMVISFMKPFQAQTTINNTTTDSTFHTLLFHLDSHIYRKQSIQN